MSRGVLIGALPDQAPAVIETPTITLNAARKSSSTLSSRPRTDIQSPNSVSGVTLPATMLAEALKGAALPDAVDTSLIVFTNNLYAYANNSGETDSPLVAFNVYEARMNTGGNANLNTEIAVKDLANPILITIPHGPLSDNQTELCRFWDSVRHSSKISFSTLTA